MAEFRRCLRYLLATLLAMVGLAWVPPPSFALSAAPVAVCHAAHDPAAALADFSSERGPHPAYHQIAAYDAVDPWSCCASMRQNEAAASRIYDYDGPAPLVQVASVGPLAESDACVRPASLVRLGLMNVATNGGIKALPSGPKISAQWGADTYRHGGLMSTIEHINYRHAYGSGFSGVSRYAHGTSARDIKGYVDYVLRNGTVTDRGMIGNVGRTIGTDRAGNSVSGLEIIVRDGVIKTAYPVGVP